MIILWEKNLRTSKVEWLPRIQTIKWNKQDLDQGLFKKKKKMKWKCARLNCVSVITHRTSGSLSAWNSQVKRLFFPPKCFFKKSKCISPETERDRKIKTEAMQGICLVYKDFKNYHLIRVYPIILSQVIRRVLISSLEKRATLEATHKEIAQMTLPELLLMNCLCSLEMSLKVASRQFP